MVAPRRPGNFTITINTHTHTNTHTHMQRRNAQTGRHHAKNAGDAETHAANTIHARERARFNLYGNYFCYHCRSSEPKSDTMPASLGYFHTRFGDCACVRACVCAFVLHTGKRHWNRITDHRRHWILASDIFCIITVNSNSEQRLKPQKSYPPE